MEVAGVVAAACPGVSEARSVPAAWGAQRGFVPEATSCSSAGQDRMALSTG